VTIAKCPCIPPPTLTNLPLFARVKRKEQKNGHCKMPLHSPTLTITKNVPAKFTTLRKSEKKRNQKTSLK
jgi:hypothetical protein